MEVKVLKLDEKVFDGEATKAVLPAADGEMTLLPNHISIVTVLKKGRLTIHQLNKESFSVEIISGICSFSDNCASIVITPVVD